LCDHRVGPAGGVEGSRSLLQGQCLRAGSDVRVAFHQIIGCLRVVDGKLGQADLALRLQQLGPGWAAG
jgi:hypothetical protein